MNVMELLQNVRTVLWLYIGAHYIYKDGVVAVHYLEHLLK